MRIKIIIGKADDGVLIIFVSFYSHVLTVLHPSIHVSGANAPRTRDMTQLQHGHLWIPPKVLEQLRKTLLMLVRQLRDSM